MTELRLAIADCVCVCVWAWEIQSVQYGCPRVRSGGGEEEHRKKEAGQEACLGGGRGVSGVWLVRGERASEAGTVRPKGEKEKRGRLKGIIAVGQRVSSVQFGAAQSGGAQCRMRRSPSILPSFSSIPHPDRLPSPSTWNTRLVDHLPIKDDGGGRCCRSREDPSPARLLLLLFPCCPSLLPSGGSTRRLSCCPC